MKQHHKTHIEILIVHRRCSEAQVWKLLEQSHKSDTVSYDNDPCTKDGYERVLEQYSSIFVEAYIEGETDGKDNM